MLEETYLKFKKNILPKIKKKEPNIQEPTIEYCEPDRIIDICSYNHYPVQDKASEKTDNDIYDTLELEHEFEYGIYEDVLKTEELMAELKCIDEIENENKKLRDIKFQNFPLEEFSEAGKVSTKGDPHLKAAADTELYELEERAIQMDTDDTVDEKSGLHDENDIANTNADDITHFNDNEGFGTNDTDDTARLNADEYSSHNTVSHVHKQMNADKGHIENTNMQMHKTVYGPTYVPYKEEGQKILLPQTTDMSRKDNLKQLFNSQPEGMCNTYYDSIEQETLDAETFSYSHEISTKHVLVQGVYVGSASPLIADIKTDLYSVITYTDDGMLTGTYDNTHDIPIYVDHGSMLNIMPTHFYDKAYYLHHLPKENTEDGKIHTGNGPVRTHFWIDILLNVQGCMLQFKLLVCDTQAQTGILLSKMALEQLQMWQDYSTNTLYIKQTAIPLHANQNIELLPNRKTVVKLKAKLHANTTIP